MLAAATRLSARYGRLAGTLLGAGLAASLLGGCAARHAASPAAQSYLAIANPANHILDRSFDALDDHRDDLAASTALLRTIAATERRFDQQLSSLRLPSPMRAVAADVVRVNETRAEFTARAARALSLAVLAEDLVDVEALNVPVEAQVRALRRLLKLPPPDTS